MTTPVGPASPDAVIPPDTADPGGGAPRSRRKRTPAESPARPEGLSRARPPTRQARPTTRAAYRASVGPRQPGDRRARGRPASAEPPDNRVSSRCARPSRRHCRPRWPRGGAPRGPARAPCRQRTRSPAQPRPRLRRPRSPPPGTRAPPPRRPTRRHYRYPPQRGAPAPRLPHVGTAPRWTGRRRTGPSAVTRAGAAAATAPTTLPRASGERPSASRPVRHGPTPGVHTRALPRRRGSRRPGRRRRRHLRHDPLPAAAADPGLGAHRQ